MRTEYQYNKDMEAIELDLIRRERLEDQILTNQETFHRLGIRYAMESMNIPLEIGFLDWAVQMLIDEEEPEYSRAWRTV